jgi:DNA ligase-1
MSENIHHTNPNSSPPNGGIDNNSPFRGQGGEAGGGFGSFASLLFSLGTSTKTNDKLQALSAYFAHADEKDKVWVIALFSGRRPRRTVSGTQLAVWCCELVDLPIWLFQECYHTVGDLSETIALLIPESSTSSPNGGGREGASRGATNRGAATHPLHYYVEKFQQLEKATEPEKKTFILQSWLELSSRERFVFNKLLSGTFRVGVSQKLMVNALARTVQLEPSVIAHRISGNWDPATTSFEQLLSEQSTQTDHSKPYPFYLAYALEGPLQELGEPADWQAEWKWDGIRGQIIKRNDQLFVWSRGEDLITDKFPEYSILQSKLENGTVIDGEILPYKDGQVLNFNVLQTRIGRKNITKKNLQEAPVGFFAYDLLELNGEDIRHWALAERRAALETLVNSLQLPWLQLSPIVTFTNWDELTTIREQSRSLNSEGLMLKRRASAYQVGRKRGDWWKWKIDPLTIDAVMVYAQKGAGRRSNLYTDYTFAVKDGDKLVPFTKAYSGLTDKEFAQVDSFVKKNSLEKFGPVRTVKPELVFEIAFEGIAASNRHKSGVALRFPRISRWRTDKLPNDINTLEDLKKMLELYGK